MSLDSGLLNVTDRSSLLSASVDEDSSIFNNNVELSLLETSVPPMDETAAEESTIQTGCKLSITLDQDERDILTKQKGRTMRTDSLLMSMSSLNGNHTMTPAKHELTNGNNTKTQYISVEEDASTDVSRTIQEVMEEEDDESVIPVEDEDSTLQTTKPDSHCENVASEMFLHLQPEKKAITDTEEVMEAEAVEQNVEIPQESYVEEESSQLLPDESGFFKHPFVELGRRLWLSTDQQQCYTKGCLWSPDGTCLLVPVHMDGMHVMELPTDLYTTQELNANRELSPLNTAVHVEEGGMVYDCSWYPFMNSTEPATCCWLASRQHEPIQMWDAFSGELRCSYRGYDDVDEVESAISIAFSNDGQKVVGGYKKNIKIFDTNIPGRDYTSIPIKQTVSCFAFTNENDNCVTTGSWNSHIYHYDLRAPKLGPLFILGQHTGGITWLKYSAYNTDNWYLFSGARKDDRILQWDMRNYQKPVKTYERKVGTNQRVYFDMSPLQKWLISGDTDGLLRIWDVDGNQENIQIPLHADCCNGASFHPSLPIISTSSGQFHFFDTGIEAEKSGESAAQKIVNYENSVLFLWFGPSNSI